MLRLLSIPLALVALLAGAMVWSGGGSEQKRADFTYIGREDVKTLDLARMSYLQDLQIGYALWEGLYYPDGQTLEPVPGVAKGHEVNAQKTVYTFHLRPETRWSNGEPVTSRDFVFAWRRMLESPGEYTYLHYYIRNAEAYCRGYRNKEPVDFSMVGVESPDTQTLRVTLAAPVPFFLDLVAFVPFYPLHEKSMRAFARSGKDGRVVYDQEFTRPPNIVSNGPFKLVKWEFKRRLRLEANEHYWDRANVKSRSIEMMVVLDGLTSLRRYEYGKVDWLAEVPAEVGPELIKQNRLDMHNFPGFGTAFVVLNCKPALSGGRANPMADPRVRRALGMALDKKTIVRTVTRMGEQPATTYIPPDVFAEYRGRGGPGFDVEGSRRLLAEAGYPRGAGFPRLTFTFRGDRPAGRDLVQNIVKQWSVNLGINVGAQMMEGKAMRARLNAREHEIAVADWTGDYNDPSTFTDKYRSSSEKNDSAWINAQYDRLVAESARDSDPRNRRRLLERAEQILNDQMPIIPLYHVTNNYLFRANVKGINLNPRSMAILKGVYVEGQP